MKKLRRVLLPAIIVLMGAGAAFATNATKNSSETGYYSTAPGNCIASPQQCSTSGTDVCTWKDNQNVTHNLFRNSTMCNNRLYKP